MCEYMYIFSVWLHIATEEEVGGIGAFPFFLTSIPGTYSIHIGGCSVIDVVLCHELQFAK